MIRTHKLNRNVLVEYMSDMYYVKYIYPLFYTVRDPISETGYMNE